MRTLLIFLAFCSTALAQCGLRSPGFVAGTMAPTTTGVKWSLISHTIAQGAQRFNTTAINTDGANLLVAGFSYYHAGNTNILADNAGNTWIALTNTQNSATATVLFYCYNPATSPTHIFTNAYAGDTYACLTVSAWSGASSGTFDKQRGWSGTGSTAAPGAVTPSQDKSLLIAILSHDNNTSGSVSVDNGFSIIDVLPYVAATAEGGAMAYLIQETAASIEPTFNITTSTTAAASIAVFK